MKILFRFKSSKKEIAELNENIVTLETVQSTIEEQLKEEIHKNIQLNEDFKIALLDDDDHQCCICRELFIRVKF